MCLQRVIFELEWRNGPTGTDKSSGFGGMKPILNKTIVMKSTETLSIGSEICDQIIFQSGENGNRHLCSFTFFSYLTTLNSKQKIIGIHKLMLVNTPI